MLLSAVVALAGCGSSATTVTSPSGITRCEVSLSGGGNVPAQGGAATIGVSAARECAWSATAEGGWFTIRSGATGQGEGRVEVVAQANPDPAVRRGAVVLNGVRAELTQAAGECSITLADSSTRVSSAGGSGRVDVRASSSLCTWTADANVSWIRITSGASGRGSGTVAFDVAAAAGPPREGTITVAGQRFSVTQSDGCTYEIAPASHAAPSQGGAGAVTVTTGPGCPWSASTAASWLTLSAGTGSGAGTVAFTVAPNPGSPRSATATIAGQTFAVTQAAAPGEACSYSVGPRSHAVGNEGGTVSVNVTSGSSCPWTASSSVPWVRLTSPGSSAGTGAATFTVDPSSGSARTGTLVVAGETITVVQAAACSFSVSPDSLSVGAGGGSGRTQVVAGAGCAWTASSAASWIQITSGSSGSGNGEVQFQVAASTGAARSGTLTVAGRTVTVAQSAGCSFAISPEHRDVDASGGQVDVTVLGANGCEWTASSQASWLSVRETGRSGAQVTVAPNTGAARTGTVTIAGRTLTITQAAAAVSCRYSVKPLDRRVGASGRIIEIEVRTSRECSWAASSNAPWLRLVSDRTYTGDADLSVLILRNEGPEREGTLTVAGQTVTIRQRSADDDDDDDDD